METLTQSPDDGPVAGSGKKLLFSWIKVKKQTLGECLRQLRLTAKLTQVELAEKTGYAQNYISSIETDRYVPSWERILSIADACGHELQFVAKHR